MEKLMRASGISNDTTLVLYGDNNNWFAAWAFWQMKIYGHRDVRIMDGGRKKWVAEGREMSKDKPVAKSSAMMNCMHSTATKASRRTKR